MTSFKLSFFFIALFVISTQSLPNNNGLQDTKILDFIKKLVSLAEEVIDKAIELSIEIIDNLSGDWSSSETKIVDLISQVTSKFLEFGKKIVLYVGENSNDAGKKLSECVVKYNDDYVKAISNHSTIFLDCIGKDLVTFIKTLGPLAKDFSAIQKDAKEAASEINKCEGDDIQGLLCAFQAASDFLKVVAEIPSKISGDVEPTKTAFNKLLETGKTCLIQVQEPIWKGCGQIFAEIAECVIA